MEERSQRIVRAAIELAEKGGFEGVRLRDVAAHAGVALGTLYRRFRSKEELLLAALELQVAALERRMAREPARGDTPLDRITDLFTYATDGMCSRPHLARACLRSVVAGGPDLSTRVVGFHTRIEGLVVSALRGGAGAQAAAEIEERLGRALVRVWFAALTGWASGLHGRDRVVAETRSAADLMLASDADAARPLAGPEAKCLNPPSPSERAGRRGAMKIVVDYDLCEANAVCMDVCPECFRVEEDDTLTVLVENPPESLRGKVEEAVRLCPRQAIALVED